MKTIVNAQDFTDLLNNILDDERELHRVRQKTDSKFNKDRIDKKIHALHIIKQQIHIILDTDL